MKVVVFSCSLNPSSRSRLLALAAIDLLEGLEAEVVHIDLRELDLPFCDGRPGEPDVIDPKIPAVLREADLVLMAVPIYNYDVNAAAKALVELTGRAWQDRVVGFLCAAGGRGSFMSVMGLANSLLLDFHCLILPRFVYADGGSFEGSQIDPQVVQRIEAMVHEGVEIAGAIAAARAGRG